MPPPHCFAEPTPCARACILKHNEVNMIPCSRSNFRATSGFVPILHCCQVSVADTAESSPSVSPHVKGSVPLVTPLSSYLQLQMGDILCLMGHSAGDSHWPMSLFWLPVTQIQLRPRACHRHNTSLRHGSKEACTRGNCRVTHSFRVYTRDAVHDSFFLQTRT